VTNAPPFDSSPEAQAAVERARAIGYETAARYDLDLSPYIEPELKPRAALIQMGFGLATLRSPLTVNDDGTIAPGHADPDVAAAIEAVTYARDLRMKDVLPELLDAISRYDAATAR
jgi:hypothetical protein